MPISTYKWKVTSILPCLLKWRGLQTLKENTKILNFLKRLKEKMHQGTQILNEVNDF